MGERIALLRQHLGLTQAELGQRIHVSASTIGMYEQGRRMPSVGILDALSQELGAPIDYLVRGYPCPRVIAISPKAYGETFETENNEVINWIQQQEDRTAIYTFLVSP